MTKSHKRQNYRVMALLLVSIALMIAARAQEPIGPVGTLIAAHRGPASAYPNASITGEADPKVTQANIVTTICVDHYTKTVRAVTEATKNAVLKRDGKTALKCCEVDHFLSLEIGGTNNPDKNLWAQPYVGIYGARVKDVVETSLHRLVCAGNMQLIDAQECITSDWIACGRRIGAIK